MRRRGKVIYPSYFDSRLSRSEGRRVPRDLSVRGPSLQELVRALSSLPMRFEVEKDKKRPSRWYRSEGRVIVDYEGRKEQLLKIIAAELVRQRFEVPGGSPKGN